MGSKKGCMHVLYELCMHPRIGYAYRLLNHKLLLFEALPAG